MALYTRDSIERVREAVDMFELVGTKTDLRRVGTQWAGLCPFHEEGSPSLSVNLEAKVFHCFGCGAQGDAVGFVEQSEGVSFREAIELLATRYGVQLDMEPGGLRFGSRHAAPSQAPRRSRRLQPSLPPQRLARARSDIERYIERCHQRLTTREGYWARRWLYARGLTDDEIVAHRVGLDPGYRALGRAQRAPPNVTLPLFDETGAVTYVQGRVLEPASDAPKFLNPNSRWSGPSPRISTIRSPSTVDRSALVVCEGICDGILAARYFDTRALVGAQQLDEAVVAHIVEAAAGRPVVLCLDSDPAGWAGAKRLLDRITERGGKGAAVPLPAGDLSDLLLDAGKRFERTFRTLVESAAASARAGKAHDPTDRSTLDPILQHGHLLGLDRIASIESRIASGGAVGAHTGERNPPFGSLDSDDALATLRLERRRTAVTTMVRRDRKEAAELDRLTGCATGTDQRHNEDLARAVRQSIADGEAELQGLDRQRHDLRSSGRGLDAWLEANLDDVAAWTRAERKARGLAGPAIANRPLAVDPPAIESGAARGMDG